MEETYQPQESNKEVLVRMSDLQPQDECTIVSVANAGMEEVAEMPGISETQKYSKMAGIIKK